MMFSIEIFNKTMSSSSTSLDCYGLVFASFISENGHLAIRCLAILNQLPTFINVFRSLLYPNHSTKVHWSSTQNSIAHRDLLFLVWRILPLEHLPWGCLLYQVQDADIVVFRHQLSQFQKRTPKNSIKGTVYTEGIFAIPKDNRHIRPEGKPIHAMIREKRRRKSASLFSRISNQISVISMAGVSNKPIPEMKSATVFNHQNDSTHPISANFWLKRLQEARCYGKNCKESWVAHGFGEPSQILIPP